MVEKKGEEWSMTKKVAAPGMTDKVDTQSRKKKNVVTPNTTTKSGTESKVGTQSRKKQKVLTPNTTRNVNVDTRTEKVATRNRKKKVAETPNTTTNLSVESRTEKVSTRSRRKEGKKVATQNTTTNVHIQSSTERVGAPSTTEKKARTTFNATRNAASVNKNISAPKMTEMLSGQSMKQKAINALRITDNMANASNATEQCSVDPGNIRFTQESIASHFKAPYEHFSLREAVELINAGKLSVDDFPRLQVMSYRGCLWSADNRRLWVFRMANCSEVIVKIVTNMHPRFKGVIDYPRRCEKLSKSDFLPRVTGSKDMFPLPTAVASINLQCRVEEMITLQFGGLEPVELAVAMDSSVMARRAEAKELRPAISNEDIIGLLTLVFKVFLLLTVLYIFS